MTGSSAIGVTVWTDATEPDRSVLPAVLDLVEQAGVRAGWQVTALDDEVRGARTDRTEAGLLLPFDAVGADAYRAARRVRQTWGGAVTLIERKGRMRRGGDMMDVLLMRCESDLSDTGIEFDGGSAAYSRIRAVTADHGPRLLPEKAVVGVHAAHPEQMSAFFRTALRLCVERNIDAITVAHKGNSVKHTDGLFALTAEEVLDGPAEAAGIRRQSLIIDHMAAEVVRDPGACRAVLTHAAFADLLAALLAGRLETRPTGVCTTLDADGVPLFGHDPALDSAPSGPPTRVGRLRSGLAAGAALAEHLRLPRAVSALRRAATALAGHTAADASWGPALTAAGQAIREEHAA